MVLSSINLEILGSTVLLTNILITLRYVFRRCPQCSLQKDATKKLNLWKLPNTLIINFVRFSYDTSGVRKIFAKVLYPIEGLSLDRFVANQHEKNIVYDLVGVCNHHGDINDGHCKWFIICNADSIFYKHRFCCITNSRYC